MPESRYQQLILDGSFPTVTWFEHLPRTTGDVLDVGCSEGTFSYLYKLTGAAKVTGVELDPDRPFYHDKGIDFHACKIEDFTPTSYDLALFSMIIHWMDTPQETIKKIADVTRRQLCFIFRLPNPHYKIPDNGKWFPTRKQLREFIEPLGFKETKHIPMLMEQDNEKAIAVSVFERTRVVKAFDATPEWRFAVTSSGFPVDIAKGSYSIPYYDGIDLQEDRPFARRHDKVRYLELASVQRGAVIGLLCDTLERALESGYLYADFTRRNVILVGSRAHLIDFDVMIKVSPDVPIPQSYIDIYQEMLDYLEVDYKFDGRIKDLYENIC